jgi:hypothetical protein
LCKGRFNFNFGRPLWPIPAIEFGCKKRFYGSHPGFWDPAYSARESYITISFLGEGKQVSGPHLQHTERRWSRCCRLAPYDFKFIQIDTRIRQTVKTNYGDGRRDVFRIFFFSSGWDPIPTLDNPPRTFCISPIDRHRKTVFLLIPPPLFLLFYCCNSPTSSVSTDFSLTLSLRDNLGFREFMYEIIKAYI